MREVRRQKGDVASVCARGREALGSMMRGSVEEGGTGIASDDFFI